jgi:hypothetical protein
MYFSRWGMLKISIQKLFFRDNLTFYTFLQGLITKKVIFLLCPFSSIFTQIRAQIALVTLLFGYKSVLSVDLTDFLVNCG